MLIFSCLSSLHSYCLYLCFVQFDLNNPTDIAFSHHNYSLIHLISGSEISDLHTNFDCFNFIILCSYSIYIFLWSFPFLSLVCTSLSDSQGIIMEPLLLSFSKSVNIYILLISAYLKSNQLNFLTTSVASFFSIHQCISGKEMATSEYRLESCHYIFKAAVWDRFWINEQRLHNETLVKLTY